MSSLDSRFLHVGDCYGHRFTRAGTIPYELSRSPLPPVASSRREPALAITVAGSSGEHPGMRQHKVAVRELDGALLAEPAQLEIAVGDAVLWVPDKTVEIGFCVRALDGETFDSASLTRNSLYTHAFGLAGRHRWRDAHGSALCGEVLVTMPKRTPEERGQWLEALSKGTVVHVGDEHATPAVVEIMVGQTVFWAIEKAPGVSITDVTLLGKPDKPS